MKTPTMNVSLTPELDAAVQDFVKLGFYGNQSEVIRAGLRLLIEREEERLARLEALKLDVREGLLQIQAGNTIEISAEEFKAKMKRKS